MKLKQYIKKILKVNEHSRDNVMHVMREYLVDVCYMDIQQASTIAMKYSELAKIDRYWRLVQMENPELRGEQWVERQRWSRELKDHYIKTKEIK